MFIRRHLTSTVLLSTLYMLRKLAKVVFKKAPCALAANSQLCWIFKFTVLYSV